MDIRDRIQQRLDALGKSARSASLDAGLNTHFLQKYLSNPDHSIKVENLRKLAPVLETTPEWLLSGIGPEYQDPELDELRGIWDRIPQDDQVTAIRMLKGLAKDGTGG
jgi:transcriptional regulator with XRE-family HTH domain